MIHDYGCITIRARIVYLMFVVANEGRMIDESNFFPLWVSLCDFFQLQKKLFFFICFAYELVIMSMSRQERKLIETEKKISFELILHR